jgi:hypothetical protein
MPSAFELLSSSLPVNPSSLSLNASQHCTATRVVHYEPTQNRVENSKIDIEI